MASRVEIRPATLEDARALAPRLRPAEAAEVAASHGLPPLAALEEAVRCSEEVWAALFDGELACLWGVAPLSRTALGGRRGSVWLLTSDLVDRRPKTFWRHSARELAALFDRWDVLVNAIDARYDKALRWGARLGFRLEEPLPFGVEDRPFCVFEVRREDIACALR